MANVELLFGPMLIGVFLNMILYGVMVMQMFVYFQTYKKDSVWIKSLVFYLFCIETANTACDIGMMYEPLIARYGTVDAVTFFPILFATEPAMIVAISTPIQAFIAWRIMKIRKSRIIMAVICAFSICSLGGGIWTSIEIVRIRRFARKPELHAPALVWFLTSAAADIIITVSLVHTLYKRKTGYSVTDDVINRIIRMTVQTGMITALAAAGDVIFFLTLPHTTLNFIWDLALSKLYTNSLMSTLNARAGWNNNIAQGNLLFDDSRSTRRPEHISMHYPAIASAAARPGVYELESQKSMHTSSQGGTRSPVEYEISVTKVVERVEDPLPSSHYIRESQ